MFDQNLFCMRKTVETMSMSKETELFNQTIDLFFSMNPSKRHWILLALYLAKNKKLAVLDNYIGEDLVLSVLDIDLLRLSDTKNAEEWERKSVFTRSVVAILDKEQRPVIEDIYNSFDNESQDGNSHGLLGIKQMEPTYLLWIAETLNSLSDEWFCQNTRYAVDSIMKKMIDEDHNVGEFYQPKELTELALMLLDANVGSVYNPYAGVGSYGAALNPNCKYYGQETSDWNVVGILNLLINGKENYVLEKEDSVSRWKGEDNYDYIISTPPFKVKCNSKYHFCDIDFLIHASKDAKEKAIGIFRSGICFSKNSLISKSIVELVEKDWVEYVISLPQGIFSTTGIQTVMLVINKSKNIKGRVRFVDASDCLKKDERSKTLCINSVWNLVTCSMSKSDYVIDVNISDIKDNGYVLSPEFYLSDDNIEVPQGFEIHTISEYLSPIKTNIFNGEAGKVFSPSKILDRVNSRTIYVSDLEISLLKSKLYKSVNRDCVVLRFMNRLELFHLICNGDTVILPPFYWAFDIDKERLDPLYLSSEIQKDYFASQIDKIKSIQGKISSITSLDFLGLKILVPIDRSQQLVLASKSKASTFEALESELKQQYQKQLESFEHNQRQRKHAVAQVLNEIEPSIEIIEDFILKNNSVSKDSIVSRRFGTTFHEYISSMRKQLEKVIKMVDSFTNQEQFGKAENICLNEFLSEYCQIKRSMQIDVNYDIYKEDSDMKVVISYKDLTQMFDNLISNATKYGISQGTHSKDDDGETNRRVKIRIKCEKCHKDNRDFVNISISNNGEPVSKSISLEQLFTWGIGQGTGIGCYQVKDIAEHFGGSVSYKEYQNASDGFSCEFNIVLPLNDD